MRIVKRWAMPVIEQDSFAPTFMDFTKALFEGVSETFLFQLDRELGRCKKALDIQGYIACFEGTKDEFIEGAQRIFIGLDQQTKDNFAFAIRQEKFPPTTKGYKLFLFWREQAQAQGEILFDPDIPF